MLDDLLGQIFGEVVLEPLGRSRRAQLLFRVFFGLLGGALGMVGAVHFVTTSGLTSNGALRLSMVALFAGVAGFSLFNVALARRWRWPGVMVVVSLVLMFVTRILFGA